MAACGNSVLERRLRSTELLLHTMFPRRHLREISKLILRILKADLWCLRSVLSDESKYGVFEVRGKTELPNTQPTPAKYNGPDRFYVSATDETGKTSKFEVLIGVGSYDPN